MSDIGRFSGFDRFAGFGARGETAPDRRPAGGRSLPGDPGAGDPRLGGLDADMADRLTLAIARLATTEPPPGDDPGATPATGEGDAETSGLPADAPADASLLAMSTAPIGQPFALFAEVSGPPAGVRADTGAMIDRISRHVEAALKAELAPLPGQPVRLDLRLDELIPGLDGISLTMTAGALEVVLNRSGGPADEALKAAAAGLAERLRTRFGKRIVRIYERGPATPATASDATEA